MATAKLNPTPSPEPKISPGDSVAKTPLAGTTARSRTVKRMESELGELYQEHGKAFASWWHAKTENERKKMLLFVTYDTMPLKRPSLDEIRRDLSGSPTQARALFEYSVDSLIGQCKCEEGCNHYHNDMILHEIFGRTISREDEAQSDWKISISMKESGIFPELYPGPLAFIAPDGEGGMGEPMVFTNEAPGAVIKEWKERVKEGHVIDASIGTFMLSRKFHSLAVLIKLFDSYQEEVRRCVPKNPYERLLGCQYCHRSCEGDDAIRCNICRLSWFCCGGCMDADGHKKCPQKGACDSKVVFR